MGPMLGDPELSASERLSCHRWIRLDFTCW